MTAMPRNPDAGSGRKARIMTPKALRVLALGYLARYAASRATVARFLSRRLERAAAAGQAEADTDDIAFLLDDLERLGLIDDGAFSRTKANSLSRRGFSARGLTARLQEAGVDESTAKGALEALAEEGDCDLRRAWRYAKRRRLGPFRPPGERSDRRTRDLAALSRRGFGLDVAKTVVDATESEITQDAPASLTGGEDTSG